MFDDADSRRVRPLLKPDRVDATQRDSVVTAFGIIERRLDRWDGHDRDALARIRVLRPSLEHEVVASEVRSDLALVVDGREVDPRAIALRDVRCARLDVRLDLRKRERIATRRALTADERETERTERGDHERVLRAFWERRDHGAWVVSRFEIDLQRSRRRVRTWRR